MREAGRPAPHADAEVTTALKALLIVLLSTVLLPPALFWLSPVTKRWQEWQGGQPWASPDLVQQLEIFLPGKPMDLFLLPEIHNRFTEGFETKDLQEAQVLLEDLR